MCGLAGNAGRVLPGLKEGLLEPLAVTERLAIISVVGDGMRTLRGISVKFFAALARANSTNIVAIAQGSSRTLNLCRGK
ncbi:ACT domain-containing protein [Escherichia coli]